MPSTSTNDATFQHEGSSDKLRLQQHALKSSEEDTISVTEREEQSVELLVAPAMAPSSQSQDPTFDHDYVLTRQVRDQSVLTYH